MRLKVRIFQDAAHRAVADLDAFASNVIASNEADQCVTGSPTSVGSRQASASNLAASASEREKAAGPISGRPQAFRPALRNRSAVASLGPCARAHPARALCPCPARRRPSSAVLAPYERPAAPPSQAASQQRSARAPPRDKTMGTVGRPPCGRPASSSYSIMPRGQIESLSMERRIWPNFCGAVRMAFGRCVSSAKDTKMRKNSSWADVGDHAINRAALAPSGAAITA